MKRHCAQTVSTLARRVNSIQPKARRRLIAIAGPPASGKSTLAEQLVAELGPTAALVAMDGYHLDNRLLDARGLRPRKGTPQTFDASGFVHTVRRLATEDEVAFPVFDRCQDIAISGAQSVGRETETVVVEGNYLLLHEAPWSELHRFWDLTVSLNVPEETLTRRLIQRWRDYGLSLEQAEARARSNDLLNALYVTDYSVGADIRL